MKLSARIEKSKGLKGQAGHDFDDRPEYADPDRKDLNRTIIGGTQNEIIALINAQANSIKERYNKKAQKERDAVSSPAEKRKITSWRKTTATHKTMIITFCSEFRARQNEINKAELDECAEKFLEDFCKKNGCEPTYLVRHDDETCTHYHATFTNVDEKTLKPLSFKMKDLSELQDQAGASFSPMGITRGIKRNERLDIARTNNPQLENETYDEYSKRIYKLANVMHRPVRQLHEDLPREIKAKQVEIDALKDKLKDQQEFFNERQNELEEKISFISSKLTKVTKNLSNAEARLENTVNEDAIVTDKIEKNIRIYERRQSNLSAQLAEAESEFNKISTLVKDERAELEDLRRSPIKKEIGNIYEVVTSKSLLKNETKKMRLIEPSRYKELVKQLTAKQKFNDKRKNGLDGREQRLNNLEKNLNRDRSAFNELVDKRVSERIIRSSKEVRNAVLETCKYLMKDDLNDIVPYKKRLDMSNSDMVKTQKNIDKQIEKAVDDYDLSM